jgi:polyferredoxin
MPQLIELSAMAPWLTHLSYRFYSMMLTTTLIGLVLSVLYKPRTWCTVCPISTISGQYISQKTKKEQAFE